MALEQGEVWTEYVSLQKSRISGTYFETIKTAPREGGVNKGKKLKICPSIFTLDKQK